MEEWQVILSSIVLSSIISFLGTFFITNKKIKANIEAIQTETEEEVRKKALFEKRQSYIEMLELLFNILRTKEKYNEEKSHEYQHQLNQVTARIYVYSPDSIVLKLKDFCNASPIEKEKYLRELILAIRKEINETSTLKTDDMVPIYIEPRLAKK